MRALDLERGRRRDAFDVVVCTNYLQRDLFAGCRRARPAACCCTRRSRARTSRSSASSINPAFVLGHNELLVAFSGLHVRHYREGVVDRAGGPRGVASLVAQRLH